LALAGVVPDWESMVLVGRVARPHGIRGQVVVNPETDFVEERFRPGATVWIRRGAGRPEPVRIASAQLGGRRPVIGLAGMETVEAAEAVSGCELRVPEDDLVPLAPGSYYHHQLVGCEVRTEDDRVVGQVTRVDGGASGSLLVVDGHRGEVLIPMTAGICVLIDVDAKRITVAPPEGLLELNERKRDR
jgi:16S rRNA processing protein RimM